MTHYFGATPRETFENLTERFSQLLYLPSPQDRNVINKILDELNALDYRYPLVKSNHSQGVLLINQFCFLIPSEDVESVSKCCPLIRSLITKQMVCIEPHTLDMITQWLVLSLKRAEEEHVILEILSALECLLRHNQQYTFLILQCIAHSQNPVVDLALDKNSLNKILLGTQCLELLCAPPENHKMPSNKHLHDNYELCAETFIEHLSKEQLSSFDDVQFCKLLISCLKGLQNIVLQHKEFLEKQLETLLSITKTYMVYGLSGVNFVLLPKVMPSILSVPEPIAKKIVDKRGGKVTKHRKKGSHNVKKNPKIDVSDFEDSFSRSGYVPANTSFNSVDEVSLPSFMSRLKTSDSDFSDSEAGKERKVGVMQSRVRQMSLHLLHNIIKLTDKRTMFSYWSSFIPETQLTMSHSLTTCILKDPSPNGRLVALNVLYSLLSSSKFYLAQAESSERVASFTPFSVILGSIIKQLHDCLNLALNEQHFPVLTQVLKCLTSLVQATPYHRLQPGLITKIVRNVKQFIRHKDNVVQVAALIVLGCVLVSEATIPETIVSFIKNVPQEEKEEKPDNKLNSENFDFADFSSDEETFDEVTTCPWLLKYCLENLGLQFDEKYENISPPIKLESLQILSAMSRNYFEKLMFPYLNLIANALELALREKYPEVRFHAVNTIDFMGQAMSKYLENNSHHIDKSVFFWQTLLNGSFITLLTTDQNSSLRAIACNGIGSIGSHTFEQLPRDKQLLCITSLFACSRDEDSSVKGAAVRALTICVFFPSLREDSGFIMDVIEAVHRTLNDKNVALRIKAFWSLGNLSDALVLNKSYPNEEIPEKSILHLINSSITGCKDIDKIKSNAVRALGNLLQLIDGKFSDQRINLKIEEAVNLLIECATTGSNMKVQWNACYAISNVLKNTTFYSSETAWLRTGFLKLQNLVVHHKNFKVRINAALALASILRRESYGNLLKSTWISLIEALENSDVLDDFVEYKHRDTLVEQICLALAHLIILFKPEDLLLISSHLDENKLKMQVQRVYNRVVPEKSSIFIAAFDQLNKFNDLNSDQMEVVNILRNIFDNEIS